MERLKFKTDHTMTIPESPMTIPESPMSEARRGEARRDMSRAALGGSEHEIRYWQDVLERQDPETGNPLDKALASSFHVPHSVMRELALRNSHKDR